MESSTVQFNINAKPFYSREKPKQKRVYFFSQWVLNDLKELKNELIDKYCTNLFAQMTDYHGKEIKNKYKYIVSEFLNPDYVDKFFTFLESRDLSSKQYDELLYDMVLVCYHFYKYTFFSHILNKRKHIKYDKCPLQQMRSNIQQLQLKIQFHRQYADFLNKNMLKLNKLHKQVEKYGMKYNEL